MMDNFEVCVCSNESSFQVTPIQWPRKWIQSTRTTLISHESSVASKETFFRICQVVVIPKKEFFFSESERHPFYYCQKNCFHSLCSHPLICISSFDHARDRQSDQNILKIKMWKQSLENICICRFDKNKSNISGKYKISISCNRSGAKCLPSKH
jgi:hypothetical protein